MAVDLSVSTLLTEAKLADFAREAARARRVAQAPVPARSRRRGLLGLAAATLLTLGAAAGAASGRCCTNGRMWRLTRSWAVAYGRGWAGSASGDRRSRGGPGPIP